MTHTVDGNDFKNWAPALYRIKVAGFLDETWSERLGDMKISTHFYGDQLKVTLLTGWMRDQSQLAGVLNSLYELHLPILSVQKIPEEKREKGNNPDPSSPKEPEKEE